MRFVHWFSALLVAFMYLTVLVFVLHCIDIQKCQQRITALETWAAMQLVPDHFPEGMKWGLMPGFELVTYVANDGELHYWYRPLKNPPPDLPK